MMKKDLDYVKSRSNFLLTYKLIGIGIFHVVSLTN